MTYVLQDGQTIINRYAIRTLERLSLDVGDEVRDAGEQEASKRVTALAVSSRAPIVAERVTMFTHSGGATASTGATGQ